MSWVLFVIISGQSYHTHRAVATSTVSFKTEALCQKAATQIIAPGEFRADVYCLKVKEDEKVEK